MENKLSENRGSSLPASKEEFDQAYRRVKLAYRKCQGNKFKMAEVLGLSYHAVLQALRIYEQLGKKISNDSTNR